MNILAYFGFYLLFFFFYIYNLLIDKKYGLHIIIYSSFTIKVNHYFYMESETILQDYINDRETGQDNKLKAAIGKLTADRMQELSQSIQTLKNQIPLSVLDLRQTISQNTDKMIASNEKLSESNEYYAKWMKWLTFGLVITSIVQILIIIFKG